VAPVAGGGPTGGRGTDVANIRTQGSEFPYPAYLNNIVRQIALRFSPATPAAPLRAEVRFLIHRDGSVSDITVVARSGVYAFDLDAQGAVEAAARAFGPLPSGFRDDVLPVVFSFDPSLLR
jgi:TonB family protein